MGPAATTRSEYPCGADAEAGIELQGKNNYPGRVSTIRYEDLKHCPEESVSRIFGFAGLPFDSALIKHVVDAIKFVPRRGVGTDNVAKGIVGNWKNHFRSDRRGII